MKKVLFLIIICFLFACVKKEETNCYVCKTTIVTTVPGYPTAGSHMSSTTNVCEQTEISIKAVEKSGTSTATVTMQGITATAKSTCICTINPF